MLHLRRLFYAKLGALRRERKELLRQVPAGVAGATPDASTRLAEINFIAQQLHDNSAAEFRAFMQLSSAYRRGVRFLRCTARPVSPVCSCMWGYFCLFTNVFHDV